MMEFIFIIIVFIVVLISISFLHYKNVNGLQQCNMKLTEELIEETLCPVLNVDSAMRGQYSYVFHEENMPLGRASAFLNYFGRSIYDENVYLFLCNRSSRDNEFREYGCLIGKEGIYISLENPNNKQCKEKDPFLKAKDHEISFKGLTQVAFVGAFIGVVHVRENKLFDSIRVFKTADAEQAKFIHKICKAIIKNEIGFGLLKNPDEEVEPFSSDEIFNETDRILQQTGNIKGMEAAGVEIARNPMETFWNENKRLMDGKQGHGYAAEYANNTIDRLRGKTVENAAQNLDINGRQKKNGADRNVNGMEIQTKYCKTAKDTIRAAFDDNGAKYIRSDGSEKMMQIEVPKDQYKEAIQEMQAKIDSGQVPGVEQGENAKDYVRKGYFTYEQSYNIAKAGTIESITVDAVSGAICCVQAAGITAVIIFAQGLWHGLTPEDAFKQCLHTGLIIMGKGTLIYTLTMQLSRKEVALVFANKMYSADGIPIGHKTITNPINMLAENVADRLNKSVLANTNVGKFLRIDNITGRQCIGNVVVVGIVFGPDVMRCLSGKISTKQLLKNTAVGAGGMAGAVAGQAAIPIPIVGAVIGGAVGSMVTKKVLDNFVEDDAKEMFRILKEEFLDQIMLANLSEEEFQEVTKETVGNKKITKLLQNMYQAKNHRLYAKEKIMIPAILIAVKKRKKISNQQFDSALIEFIV